MKEETFIKIKADLSKISTVVEKMEPLFEGFPIITTLRVAIRNVSLSSEDKDVETLKDLVEAVSEYAPEFYIVTWVRNEVVISIQGHLMCEEYGTHPYFSHG